MEWPEGYQLAQRGGISLPQVNQENQLRQHLSLGNRRDLSDDAIDLLTKMLKHDGGQRITA